MCKLCNTCKVLKPCCSSTQWLRVSTSRVYKGCILISSARDGNNKVKTFITTVSDVSLFDDVSPHTLWRLSSYYFQNLCNSALLYFKTPCLVFNSLIYRIDSSEMMYPSLRARNSPLKQFPMVQFSKYIYIRIKHALKMISKGRKAKTVFAKGTPLSLPYGQQPSKVELFLWSPL